MSPGGFSKENRYQAFGKIRFYKTYNNVYNTYSGLHHLEWVKCVAAAGPWRARTENIGNTCCPAHSLYIIHLTRGNTRQYTKGQDKSKSEPHKYKETFSRKYTFEKKAKKKERKNVYLSFLSFSRWDNMIVTTACTYSLHSGIFCHVIRNTSLLYIVVGR